MKQREARRMQREFLYVYVRIYYIYIERERKKKRVKKQRGHVLQESDTLSHGWPAAA